MKILIGKDNVNALTEKDPSKLKFSSDFGTLKYFAKISKSIQFTANGPGEDISARGTVDHNLGYYPYVEAYVKVGSVTPGTVYEYCPFTGAGATVFYAANIIVTKSQIIVYGEINGVSTNTWYFDFLLFIFRNNLGF